MAIIVEEEKNKVNLIRLGGWIIFFGVIIAAAYYIFFAAPELVIIPTPPSLTELTPIASLTLTPTDVLNSPDFTQLQTPSFPLPTAQGPASVGRPNPFIAP